MNGRESDSSPAGELSLTGKDALGTRKQAQAARVAATRKMKELEKLRDSQLEELKRAQQQLEAEFARRKAELEAQVAPLREQLARITEVLWTVDLYLGRDERIRQFREGAPAPAETPITIRQRVLSMAEESLIHLDKGGQGMGWQDVEQFLNWLTSSAENLDRVLPEQKGVVVLVPTFVESRAENLFERAYRDQMNTLAHWIIRNGENLYLLTTDENLTISKRLLPRRDEFVKVFERRLFGFGGSSEPVRPGSDEWMAMEKHADALQRHYMRILLVLQGLIDRTTVWHPLPEGRVNLLSLADQDSDKITLLQDEDPSVQLTDGRESFRTFRARLNTRLRPGMRVILSMGSDDFNSLRHEPWRHPRISPETAGRPSSLQPHLIEGRRHGALFIRYERTDGVWKRNVPVPDEPGYVYREKMVDATRRASLSFYPHDSWVIPFDLVTIEDLNYYLYSRENRSKDLLEMVPLLKAALKVKEEERDQERPFRDLLESTLDAEGLTVDVDELIHAWKVRHTYARPLNGDAKHEAKAAREIIREARLRKKADSEAEIMVPKGRAIAGTVAIALQTNTPPRWVALVPSAPGSMFHDVHPLFARKQGTGTVEREVFAGHLFASKLIVAWSTEEWEKTLASPLQQDQALSPSEETRMLDAALAIAAREGVPPLAVTKHFDRERPDEGWSFRVIWLNDGKFERRALVANRDARTKQLVTKEAEVRRGDGLYTGTGFRESVPWAGPEHDHYTDARHRLIWSDEEQMNVLRERMSEREAAREQEWAEQRRLRAVVDQWVTHIDTIVEERLIAAERERFLEDFGSGQDDLWPGHLKSRQGSKGMRKPWRHGADLYSAVNARVEGGQDIAGVSLADLFGAKLTRPEFDDLVIPPLPNESEPTDESA